MLFYTNGIDLLHAKLPILGAPWEVPFEFPLFQAMASLVMHLGIAPDTALQVTAFAAFLATGAILWALIARIGGRFAGLIALGCFLFSPFAMLWGRAALIEFLATAAALGFVWFALEWRTRERRIAYAVAIALGSIAMLVKVTIGIWLLPFLVLGPARARFGIRDGHWRSSVAAWGLVLVPSAVGFAWTHYADSIKATTASTQALTSGALTTWVFGTLDQRLQPAAWIRIATVIGTEAGGVGPILLLLIAVPLAALFVRRQGGGRLLAWLLITLASGPLIFFSLYTIHDYYSAEVAPAVAGILGLAAASLLSFQVPRVARTVGGLGLLTLWLAALIGQAGYWNIAYLPV